MNINATLFGQMITFAIFVWFTMRVIWPLLEGQLEERKKRIADGLAAAEQGREFLSDAKEKANYKINEAKSHSHKILVDASNEATQILEEARSQARKERDDIVSSGNMQISRAVKQAKVELQEQLAGLVIMGAEKILERSINIDDHKDILIGLAEKFVDA